MTGIQALTEKEKETLRLLVDGHDAKSMARHLGLSVHTINERLRDARRKMSASSSREAARQLREIEGRSEEHTSELQSLMRTSYAVFCLKKKKITSLQIQAT